MFREHFPVVTSPASHYLSVLGCASASQLFHKQLEFSLREEGLAKATHEAHLVGNPTFQTWIESSQSTLGICMPSGFHQLHTGLWCTPLCFLSESLHDPTTLPHLHMNHHSMCRKHGILYSMQSKLWTSQASNTYVSYPNLGSRIQTLHRSRLV